MVKILRPHDTNLPLYLKVVTGIKLRRIQQSVWYFGVRRLLDRHDIALMLNTEIHSAIRFYNQDIRFDVVYKRFTINDQHLYIPMEDYAKYYIDYKMRMAASVAEMLGVCTLKYHFNEVVNELTSWESQGGYASADVSITKNQESAANQAHEDTKTYDKAECRYLFVSPEEFEIRLKDINCYFIDSKTYDNDHDLRNLVRARLIGNLTEYSLKYEIAFMSQFELKLAARMYGSFAASLKQQSRRKLCVSLDISFYKMEELITTDNMNIHDNRCLQLILRGGTARGDMIYNFIERYLLNDCENTVDRDDRGSYLAYYMFLKIADKNLLASYIQGIKSLDDLSPGGYLAVSLRSTVFAALLAFNDDGYSKLQQIYVHTLREFRDIESANVSCFNLRCLKPDCPCPLRYLKRIFVYIMRTYNHENPDTPLMVALETDESFARALYAIATNIIVIPNYAGFVAHINKKLEPFSTQDAPDEMDLHYISRATEGIHRGDYYTTPPLSPVVHRRLPARPE